jgi:hypothetical protein
MEGIILFKITAEEWIEGRSDKLLKEAKTEKLEPNRQR